MNNQATHPLVRSRLSTGRAVTNAILLLLVFASSARAQSSRNPAQYSSPDTNQALQQRISILEAEVAELKAAVAQIQTNSSHPQSATTTLTAANFQPATPTPAPSVPTPSVTVSTRTPPQSTPPRDDSKLLGFLHDTTINVALDGYYGYNFNHPIGRVNLLRAYDVLSNEFSLNQADVIFDHPPDVADGRRWGGRLDVQFGQATDTLQGNPANEPRPDIYRNIFQAYGTYLAPAAKAWKSISENGAVHSASKATTQKIR